MINNEVKKCKRKNDRKEFILACSANSKSFIFGSDFVFSLTEKKNSDPDMKLLLFTECTL